MLSRSLVFGERTVECRNVLRLSPVNSSVLWTVKHNCWGYHWHRVCQSSQLILTMSIAAVFTEFANSRFHEVATDLSLIIGQKCTNILAARVVYRHWIVNVAFLVCSVRKGTHFAQRASFGLHPVPTESRFVLLPLLLFRLSFLHIFFSFFNSFELSRL